MSNMLVNTRDQKFVLYEQIGIDKLFETEKYAEYNRETVDMMLNEAEKLAIEVLLPTYDKGDKEGCKFEKGRVKVPACFHDAYRKFCEGGWLNCMRSVESGGQGMPN
ncbi:MAG TPA: acyl-CoA dehydrogenase N-terminal domain-containing protein, partial [Syntrophales bacterium]|nr:acyl-CoA dehydrogenase N-terminal domain-containing protein [Syntrophales bacterium]